MAVPASVTTANISGTYILNKSLSDSSEGILKQQGVAWLVRKAVANSTVTVVIKHFTGEDGKIHIEQTQTSSFGMSNQDDRILDSEPREKENWIWGKVKSWNRLVTPAEIEDEYLKEGWEEGGDLIEAISQNEKAGWKATQIFGFAVVNGERRQVRKAVSNKGNEVEKMRQVYDWKTE